MEITLKEITIRDLVNGYIDNADAGVKAYGGLLDVRPPYQREFVYNDKQRDAVIETVSKGFPLNVMYWAVREDGTFEVIDGQQRTISICQYATGAFSINYRRDGLPAGINNLTIAEREQFLSYKLMVYFCSGDPIEKLNWFETINIAGEELTTQEMLNAIYSGAWVTDAKRYFSKRNCTAYQIAKDYMSGNCIRQDYLETAIDWLSEGDIKEYMAAHQHDANANELWLYFQSVVSWVQVLFPVKRKEMKSVAWGRLYNALHIRSFDAAELETRVQQLMMDDDVTKKSGIYEYVLMGNERALSIRAFTDNMKREAYERQGGICPLCGKHFEIENMEADHITPWAQGGRTITDNCQMLCRECNRRKSDK